MESKEEKKNEKKREQLDSRKPIPSGKDLLLDDVRK